MHGLHIQVASASDSRMRRTRHALLSAFIQLVLTRRYDQIKVADIIARAEVGRSTFYEHFRSKDDLLEASLNGPFSVLADTITDRHDMGQLQHIVDHFWENRRLARITFSPPLRLCASRALAKLFEQHLAPLYRSTAAPPVPAHLLAVQLAESQLGLLRAWLTGKAPCKSDAIAQTLFLTTTASLAALRQSARHPV